MGKATSVSTYLHNTCNNIFNYRSTDINNNNLIRTRIWWWGRPDCLCLPRVSMPTRTTSRLRMSRWSQPADFPVAIVLKQAKLLMVEHFKNSFHLLHKLYLLNDDEENINYIWSIVPTAIVLQKFQSAKTDIYENVHHGTVLTPGAGISCRTRAAPTQPVYRGTRVTRGTVTRAGATWPECPVRTRWNLYKIFLLKLILFTSM